MLEWISELQNFGDRGVASQKVMEGSQAPTKYSKSVMIAKKANDPMVG